MKTVKIEQTPTRFFIPARDVLACYNAASTEQARYYLRGVYVEAMRHADNAEIESIWLVATDGNIMLKSDLEENGCAFVGADVSTQSDESARTRGFILSLDVADKALKTTVKTGDAWLYGDTATGIIQVVAHDGTVPKIGVTLDLPRIGIVEFEKVDGTFPEWTRLMPKAQTGGVASCMFDPALVARLAKAGSIMSGRKSAGVLLEQDEQGSPMRATFAGAPYLTGVLMPLRHIN